MRSSARNQRSQTSIESIQQDMLANDMDFLDIKTVYSYIDANTFGLMFESMYIRDLRVYSESPGGQVYHYRDKNGLECDVVLHLRNGSYGLVEIKLGGDNAIEHGA